MMGIINLLKPPGITSFGCVAQIRRITGIKKIGHTGTLDPLACGVLPLCLGKATKLVPFLLNKEKIYRGEMILGLKTTTLDLEGEVLGREQVDVSTEELLHVFYSFEGNQMQIPPEYSAKKIRGRRYYELAREGITINEKSFPVRVDYFQFLLRRGTKVLFEVKVSKGTYIRSLVRDIGERLGCGACLSFLVRTVSGPFTISESTTLEEVEEAFHQNRKDKVLLSPDKGLEDLPMIEVQERQFSQVKHGAYLKKDDFEPLTQSMRGELLRVYYQGKFVAIYQKGERDHLVAKKIFV